VPMRSVSATRSSPNSASQAMSFPFPDPQVLIDAF
jgi:hypothetical protein